MSDIMQELAGSQMKPNDYSSEVVRSYENKLTKNKKEGKLVGVEKFSEVTEDEE
jgi:hypothetical protein